MQENNSYDYAVIRCIPKVEREEFINVGVVVLCLSKKFLDARVELDEQRLRALDPDIDIDIVRVHLDAIPLICKGGVEAGPIGKLSQRERFHWLVSPRSTIIQTSPVHSGYCSDPKEVIEHLLNRMVRKPK